MKPKKLSLLLVTPWFYPAHGFGGTVQRLHRVSKYLTKWGHRVEVLTTDAVATGIFDLHLPRVESEENLTIHRFHGTISVRQFFFTPSMIRTAMKLAESSDVIHACGMRNFQTDVSLMTSITKSRPLVIQGFASVPIHQEPDSVMEPLLKLAHNGFTMNAEFRLADSYIAASIFEKNAFVAAGVPPGKVELIPSGADLEEFELEHSRDPSIQATSHSTILFVGRINIIKGIDVLLRAFKEVALSYPNVRLVIAGTDQGYGQTMEAMISNLQLRDTVNWITNPSRHDIATLMHECAMLVLPSYLESNPIVIHEAGACGKPVIASNVGGIPEVIVDGENGLLVPRGDFFSLAKSMMHLLENPALARSLGNALSKQVIDKYNWGAVAKSTERLYYKLANMSPQADLK